jgi:hypothetical protein
MTDEQKRKINPNATIQIDLDQVQLVDPNAPQESVPPPLPVGPVAPGTPSAAPPQPRSRTIAYVAMIVAFVAIAIAAGLAVGRRLGGAEPAPSAAVASPVAAPEPVTSATAPAASSAGQTLTLPTVEMK